VLFIRVPIQKSLVLIKRHDTAIARWISHVVSPHIVGLVLTAAMALRYSDNPWGDVMWLSLLIPLLIVPPFGYLLWLVHTGSIEDIYLPRRETRLRPLVVIMLWLFFCLGLIQYWQAPSMVGKLLFAMMVLVGVLSLITLFWKISFHGAAITAAATTTMMVAGSSAWPVVLLVPLVGWSRVHLKRHTMRQVIYGSLLGAMVALFLVYQLLFQL
jgi:membrane-associated phospholipid phosphatase